ncbi:hypothetical protein AQ490_08810 [Wenjunlia vitaminophila]|uniref:DUF397 domain-containing protein n=1 Tax=Wenjunlia vitaminophila TaxID=76728 RepID=A0A0T6LL74_WENVI|nr:DUF397 domain-containing protein [Wenjunlia vitaminophila]KRV46871.1 hypothetical protein AQ490_08810 [Wenjunlia vitaminophila]
MTEVQWQKSSYCAQGNSCVELARPSDGTVLLRESAEPGTVIATSPARVGALVRAVKAGEVRV